MSEGRTGGQSAARRWVTFGLRKPPQEARKVFKASQTAWSTASPGPRQGPSPRGWASPPRPSGHPESHLVCKGLGRAAESPADGLCPVGSPDRPASKVAALRLWAPSPGPRATGSPRHLGSTALCRAHREPSWGPGPIWHHAVLLGRAPRGPGRLGRWTLWAGGEGVGRQGQWDRASISGWGGVGTGQGGREGLPSECPSTVPCAGAGGEALEEAWEGHRPHPARHRAHPLPGCQRLTHQTGRAQPVTYKTVNTSL